MTKKKDSFPRTAEPPNQSPQFWVQQKDRYLRQLLIRDIEQVTQRRLCVFFSDPYSTQTDINGRDAVLLAEMLHDCGGHPLDLLLQTPGGSTTATEAILSLLRNITNDLRVVVPNYAKSNGTLICLSAKEIVMGSTSELGPIEPHINNIPCSILIQQQVAQQNYILHQHGIWALEQSKKIATMLLKNGMMKGESDQRVNGTVEILASRVVYHDHGSVIDYNEAQKLGLKIKYLDISDALWKQLWLLYCMYEHDCRTLGYIKVFEGRAISTAIAGENTLVAAQAPKS